MKKFKNRIIFFLLSTALMSTASFARGQYTPHTHSDAENTHYHQHYKKNRTKHKRPHYQSHRNHYSNAVIRSLPQKDRRHRRINHVPQYLRHKVNQTHQYTNLIRRSNIYQQRAINKYRHDYNRPIVVYLKF